MMSGGDIITCKIYNRRYSFFSIRCMHKLLVSINTTYGTSDEDPEVRRASSITSSKTGGGDSPCSERMLVSASGSVY